MGQGTAVTAEIDVEPEHTRVYAEGFMSWSPTFPLRWDEASPRPSDERMKAHFFRPGVAEPSPGWSWQADGGLLGIETGDGSTHVFAATGPAQIPVLRAVPGDRTVRVTADAPCEQQIFRQPLEEALREWATTWPPGRDVKHRAGPTGWCTWYGYKRRISAKVIAENLDVMDSHELPVDIVQIDDGWQQAIGDWTPAPGFPSIPELADVIGSRGRRTGLWFTPFIADVNSQTVADHPDWWVDDASAPFGSRRTVKILDVTHPAAAEYLSDLVRGLVQAGVSYLKADFIAWGAIDGHRYRRDVTGIAAYRTGVELLREAADDAYLVGCGAPLLPSAGTGLDAIRTSPDTGHAWNPTPEDDLSQPSGRSAVLTGRARAFFHLTWFRADLDCILAHPTTEHRDRLAEHIDSLPGGLRISGDRLPELDEQGLETTRRLLRG